MKLQTPVADEKCKVGISYSDHIMMLGSCFSDNIGRELQDYGFDVCINPFGTLYNPISILRSIERIVSGQVFTTEDCIQIGAGDERWCSFSHHTSFARETPHTFLEEVNRALEVSREKFRRCNKVIITLGTSWCFRNVSSGKIVSNCLKRPAAEFERVRLSVTEVREALYRIMELCNGGFGIPKQFIFTVSPVRHFKDGAHGNQISKAGLLLGIEGVLNQVQDDVVAVQDDIVADYFPAYEIVMDELRDYRFYAEDMCHPSAQTIAYLRDRFLAWVLPASERPLLEENIRIHKRNSHKQVKS